MKNIQVVAVIKFTEDALTEVLEPLKSLVNETRKEIGCIQYDLIETDTKGHFLMIEIWENLTSLEAHNQAKHFIDFVNLVNEKNAEVIIYKGTKLL